MQRVVMAEMANVGDNVGVLQRLQHLNGGHRDHTQKSFAHGEKGRREAPPALAARASFPEQTSLRTMRHVSKLRTTCAAAPAKEDI
jgi:hypothetical protein